MHWQFPYKSQRMPLMARNIVSTSQPLAAQAGLQMLAKGGNAVDAAVATAITLTVVEPPMNGIGSDAFAIVWDGKALQGLNASGRAPAAWTPERFAGRDTMPMLGWDSVTVPGCVSAWVALHERYGKLDFADLFVAAIRYAEQGFAVSPITASAWEGQTPKYPDYPDFAASFLPNGRPPRPGEIFRFPDQAKTLSLIASTKGKAFYEGVLAEKIVAHSRNQGGAMTMEDLSSHRADWVEPVGQDYRGYRLHEIPPNGQGIAALITLGILENFDMRKYPVDSADSIHVQIEAMKLAFADVYRHVSDPSTMEVTPAQMLAPDYLARRAKQIDMKQVKYPIAELPRGGETVYLTTADASGMMVSMIQSNFMGFGSGIVVPGTGISLQNRGYGFNVNAGHPNQVGSRKRPFQTIIPGFLTQGGKPSMSFGVMGAVMQAQGHVQMVNRIVDYEQNPQAASDAPRWFVDLDMNVSFEEEFDQRVVQELRTRGHRVGSDALGFNFGGAQLIHCLEDGYCAGSDHRKDGQAVGF